MTKVVKGDRSAPRTRRPRGSLTRGEVVDAALELADGIGLAGLTMPALALRLDCGVMTLYGYLDSKADLLEAIAQRGLRDLRLPRPLPSDAAGVLSAWGRALRGTMLEHPALAAIFVERAVIGPGILGGVEALLGALARVGYPASLGVRGIYAVLIYTIGFVAWELPRARGDAELGYERTWRSVAAGIGPERLPLVSAVVEDLANVAGEDQFELGLGALTAGLASLAGVAANAVATINVG